MSPVAARGGFGVRKACDNGCNALAYGGAVRTEPDRHSGGTPWPSVAVRSATASTRRPITASAPTAVRSRFADFPPDIAHRPALERDRAVLRLGETASAADD